jgi:hypothetical protein
MSPEAIKGRTDTRRASDSIMIAKSAVGLKIVFKNIERH